MAKDVPQAERATCKNSVETDSVEKFSDRIREILVHKMIRQGKCRQFTWQRLRGRGWVWANGRGFC